MNNNNIYILIVGPAGSGRTSIQEMIKRNLKECGLVCKNIFLQDARIKIPVNIEHAMELQNNIN